MVPPAPDDPRKIDALQTAFSLFLRFGYRKTSMDDVARAVGLSRQGLYLWFPSKQALFVATLDLVITRIREGVEAALGGEGDLPTRVAAAFVVVAGGFIDAGVSMAAMDELLETSKRLVGDRVQQTRLWFRDQLATALEGHVAGGATAAQVAEVLEAASDGFKHGREPVTVAEYETRMRLAVRAMVRP